MSRIINIKIFSLVIVLTLFCSCITLKDVNNYNKDEDNLFIRISQVYYGSIYRITYLVKDSTFYVFKQNITKISDKPSLIHKQKLNSIKQKRITTSLNELVKLDTAYITQMMDGAHWEIFICSDTLRKKITIDNTKVIVVNDLFFKLNQLLPSKKRLLILTH